jgi:hypothetical protein
MLDPNSKWDHRWVNVFFIVEEKKFICIFIWATFGVFDEEL